MIRSGHRRKLLEHFAFSALPEGEAREAAERISDLAWWMAETFEETRRPGELRLGLATMLKARDRLLRAAEF